MQIPATTTTITRASVDTSAKKCSRFSSPFSSHHLSPRVKYGHLWQQCVEHINWWCGEVLRTWIQQGERVIATQTTSIDTLSNWVTHEFRQGISYWGIVGHDVTEAKSVPTAMIWLCGAEGRMSAHMHRWTCHGVLQLRSIQYVLERLGVNGLRGGYTGGYRGCVQWNN